jgi:hypothetical protein
MRRSFCGGENLGLKEGLVSYRRRGTGGARGGAGSCGKRQQQHDGTGHWHGATAVRQGRLPNRPGLVRTVPFYLFKDFSNPFEFKMVKDGILCSIIFK